MRIRRKPWARPELAACDFYIKEPESLNGNWRSTFERPNAQLYLELGCGKGGFISQAAVQNENINYIAVDIKSEMLGLAKRKIEREYADRDRSIDNVKILAKDIELIDEVLACEDAIDRIYINFCNPWPKKKQQKHRLTYTRQLLTYRKFLKDGGEIWFKTDDDGLFEASLEYFKDAGFNVRYTTDDLWASGFEPNIKTEHEIMFSNEGIKIKFLIAVKQPDPAS